MRTNTLSDAYQYCLTLATTHYENFPVASYLLPSKLRAPMAVIYTFARTADDIVDEGDDSPRQRLDALDDLQTRLTRLPTVDASDQLMLALNDTLTQYDLPIDAFLDLLTAFRMDVTQSTYPDHQAVLGYCRYSANPVGRLVLALFGQTDPIQLAYSDHICTMLQLINFLQDIKSDQQSRQRTYLPLNEMNHVGLTPATLLDKNNIAAVEKLMKHEVERCQAYLDRGRPLIKTLSGRLKLYIALIICSAQCIINKLRARGSAIEERPALRARDKVKIFANGFSAAYF